MSAPAPGTDRYLCPVSGCAWHHDVPPVEMPPSDLAARRHYLRTFTDRVAGIERAATAHLGAHPAADFVRTIAQLQTEVARLRGDIGRARSVLALALADQQGGGDMPAG